MMSFLYPLGLLGLIGVPVLILIYIIKSKYKESVIASTYIWELSEKFNKKKSPLSKLTGLLSLLLQILVVVFISLSLAHPFINIKDAAKNYLFIIDESASMNMVSEEKTRFDRAKENILSMVDDAKDGSKFTLIEQGKISSALFENIEDKEKVTRLVNALESTTLSIDETDAINLAQTYFDNDSSLNVYYLTDTNYESTLNMEVINVSNNEYNASIESAKYNITSESIVISGNIISHNEDKDVVLELYVDDYFYSDVVISCVKDELTPFSFELPLDSYMYFTLYINNDDALEEDNVYYLFGNDTSGNFKTLIVSNNPFYLKSIISILGSRNITISSSYGGQTGYDLYVFDSTTITTLPNDGSIMLFNAKNNITNAGFTVQSYNNLESGAKISLSNEKTTLYKQLSQNVLGENDYASKYYSYTLFRNFTTVFNYKNDPMVFAGTTTDGNREAVFSFDLHDSNLPLSIDFVPLFRNLLSYLVPTFINKTGFTCGETLEMNVLPQIESIRINNPGDYSTYLPLSSDTLSYDLDEYGIYTIEVQMTNSIRQYALYSQYPIEETNPNQTKESIYLVGEKKNVGYNSQFDCLLIAFICLLALGIIEWEVYIYEEHHI